MKKVLTKLSLLLTLLVVTTGVSVYAADVNATVSASSVEQGKTFTVSVNSSKAVTDFEVTVSANGLSLPSVTSKYNGSTVSTNGTKSIVKYFQLSAQSDKSVIRSETNLATYKYTVPKSQTPGSITVTIVLNAIDKDAGKIQKATITKSVTVVAAKSTNNNLEELKVDETLVDKFSKNTTSYTLTSVKNDVESINVTATAEDSKAKVTGTGVKALKVGKNTISIVVTSESGSTKTYKIIVTRLESEKKEETSKTKSANNNLSSIKVDGKVVKGFSKSILSYTLDEVKATVGSIKVTATLENSRAKVTGTGSIGLREGVNTIKLTVTAENGSTKVYTLSVTRKKSESKDNNCNLSEIKIDDKKIEKFSKDTLEYVLSDVEFSKESIEITAKAEDSKAKITGEGSKKLEVGENNFELKVTAKDGTTKTYVIKVSKKAEDAKPVISTNTEAEDTSSNTWVYIVITIGFVIVLIFILKATVLKKK